MRAELAAQEYLWGTWDGRRGAVVPAAWWPETSASGRRRVHKSCVAGLATFLKYFTSQINTETLCLFLHDFKIQNIYQNDKRKMPLSGFVSPEPSRPHGHHSPTWGLLLR